MADPFLNEVFDILSGEPKHTAALNDCFIYFAALAETRQRGSISNLFEYLPAGLPTVCDDEMAHDIRNAMMDFIEQCPSHPNVGSTFRILLNLGVNENFNAYLLSKLDFYFQQGDAQTVFQLCAVIEDVGMKVFLDEKGAFIPSRSSCEAEINLGVARRFLERVKAGQAFS